MILLFLLCFILNHQVIYLLSKFLNLFIFDVFKKFAADKWIHNLQILDRPQRSATTERQIHIGGRLIVVIEIVTQI